MTDETLWRLLALLVLLGVSGFFSGSETALLSLDKFRVRFLQQKQRPGADKLAALLAKPDRLLSGLLVGNNLVNIAASVIATGLCVRWFGEPGEWLTVLLLTPILLIFSEVCPKTYAAYYPEKMSFRVLGPIRFIVWILAPVIVVVSSVSSLFTRFLRKKDAESLSASEDEIKAMIDVGEETGAVAAVQRRMLHGIFDLSETRVRDVMIPRTEVVGIDISANFEEVLSLIQQARHSRFPVYSDSLDKVVGVVHSKNILDFIGRTDRFSLRELCRAPYYVPESKRIAVLLQSFRKKKEHLALVVDEYGGVEGIVTLEDVVEEIVGEIHDEYDIEEFDFRKLGEGHYLIDAALPLREVNRRFDLNLPEEHVTTLAGYLLQIMGKIPVEGDSCEEGGILFRVRRMEERRIEDVEMILTEEKNR
ncbi:MAG: CNNM domain-containing protein [Deltaproteobacteria bacterium]|jgi:putative hemolysin|nr:CNNM domain-containing protein [Deltaproteobacteria bacterium]MCW8892915.1 CNNM domain-containing protein [Deltaproteobacteria bacterium]MCW9048744.1 CNNM domain-containing protein [Deltaproteobacteria bacterium]